MSDCPFCDRIAAGEYDAANASNSAVTFEPLNPVTPGHRLIVPRAHVRDAAEVPVITGRTMMYAAELAASLGEDCNLITSVGPAATQTVRHLHLHLVPRREGDGLHLPWTGQGTWPERCGYCYCLLTDAPECADGCAHRDLSGHVGCAAPLAPPSSKIPRRSDRRPTRGGAR